MAEKKITPKAAASKDKATGDCAAARVSLKKSAKTSTRKSNRKSMRRSHKKL